MIHIKLKNQIPLDLIDKLKTIIITDNYKSKLELANILVELTRSFVLENLDFSIVVRNDTYLNGLHK
ncbi:hypothetical protein QTP88_028570 [Uroleucon formosanum]